MSHSLPVALSIASSDSGAGAGIQADLLTFAACNVFGTTAIAAGTAQNPGNVSKCQPFDPAFLEQQIEQVLDYFPVAGIKVGMLFSEALIRTTAHKLESASAPIVVDPVMISSSGHALIEPSAMQAMQEKLFPLATLITPNLDEVEALTGTKPACPESMTTAGKALVARFGVAALIKGGHLEGNTLIDILIMPDGATHTFETQRIESIDTHGSGCTLSSAIAAGLAKGFSLPQAVSSGHAYLQQAMRHALTINNKRFINHFPNAWSPCTKQ